jgi:hypothetical protein
MIGLFCCFVLQGAVLVMIGVWTALSTLLFMLLFPAAGVFARGKSNMRRLLWEFSTLFPRVAISTTIVFTSGSLVSALVENYSLYNHFLTGVVLSLIGKANLLTIFPMYVSLSS